MYFMFQDVDCSDFEILLDYMYVGEASVEQMSLSRLIHTAERLQIRGLAGSDNSSQLEKDNLAMLLTVKSQQQLPLQIHANDNTNASSKIPHNLSSNTKDTMSTPVSPHKVNQKDNAERNHSKQVKLSTGRRNSQFSEEDNCISTMDSVTDLQPPDSCNFDECINSNSKDEDESQLLSDEECLANEVEEKDDQEKEAHYSSVEKKTGDSKKKLRQKRKSASESPTTQEDVVLKKPKTEQLFDSTNEFPSNFLTLLKVSDSTCVMPIIIVTPITCTLLPWVCRA